MYVSPSGKGKTILYVTLTVLYFTAFTLEIISVSSKKIEYLHYYFFYLAVFLKMFLLIIYTLGNHL